MNGLTSAVQALLTERAKHLRQVQQIDHALRALGYKDEASTPAPHGGRTVREIIPARLGAGPATFTELRTIVAAERPTISASAVDVVVKGLREKSKVKVAPTPNAGGKTVRLA